MAQMKLPPGATLVDDGSGMRLPPGATLVSGGEQQAAATTPTAPEPEGLLSRAWKFATSPTLDLAAGAGATAKGLMGVATGNPMMYDNIKNSLAAPPSVADSKSPMLYGLKQGVGGVATDSVDTAAGFTSPVSLATSGMGAAGKVPGAVGKIANAGTKLVGAGMAGKGAYDLATDNGEGTTADRIQRIANNAAMVTGGVAGATPAESVGNLFQKKAYGTMNNLLGVYGRDMKYGINPGRGVVQEGIAGASRPSILDKIDKRIPQLSDELNNTAQSPAIAGRNVNLFRSVNEPFDTALAAGDQQAGSYLNRLLATKKELTQQRTVNPGTDKVEYTGQPVNLNMNVPDALNFKQGVGRRTLFDSDTEGQNVNPTLKEVYGRTNRDIRAVAPEISPTLDRLADLTTAGSSLNSSIGRRLANPSSGIRDVAPAVVGSAVAGAPGAAAMIAGKELFSSVPARSYGAQALYRAGKNLASTPQGMPAYGSLAAAVAARKRR